MVIKLLWFMGIVGFVGLIAFFVPYWLSRDAGVGAVVVDPAWEVESSGDVDIDSSLDVVDVIRIRDPGLLLVDALHGNGFHVDEISGFQDRVVAAGHSVEVLGDFTVAEPAVRLDTLRSRLGAADAFLIIAATTAYTDAEKLALESFVAQGGRLILISDPARLDVMNSVAGHFGMQYRPDYVYNQVDNNRNFRNIYVDDFAVDEVTAGLGTIGLFNARSLSTDGVGLALAGSGSRSPMVGVGERLYVMARSADRNVLALGDFTFMIPPFVSELDNGILVDNVVEFAFAGERDYGLSDFPYFYSSAVDWGPQILLGDVELLDAGLAFNKGLGGYGRSGDLAGYDDRSQDAVFIGLYSDVAQVDEYLSVLGIEVGDTVSLPGVSGLDADDSALIALADLGNRYVTIVLGSDGSAVDLAVWRLFDGKFRDDLVSDHVAVIELPGKDK